MTKTKTRRRPAQSPDRPDQFEQWETNLTEIERRVETVVDMMLRGNWISGVSDKVMARRWGICPANARRVAAEANRVIRMRLRANPEAQEQARAQLLQNFEVIRARAMQAGDAANLRVALDALRAYGFYLGIEPAKRLEMKNADPFAGWTTDEKLEYAKTGRQPRRALNASLSTDGDEEPLH